ncbi:EAL domain-containing protein [Glaciecola sp. MH2013]|uniref:EAL and HDOD domain-containing protein n=1 Tax=Glaciecola sp. MH2013 TaxID=2785524 RepID=UPI00189F5E2E|nr:EAL domain-containing protein [Glaciecola sp. MH2013]MBF7073276.1 EAL domain-containing protein [Glaciecola sp. MH2013]
MGFFAARQPILDNEKALYGYELLFRLSLENVFPDVDQEKATSKMIEGLQFDLGLDKISEGKLAFINFTEQSLISGYPELLPHEKVVVEILETVKPTNSVYGALKKLRQKGYLLALDDFVHDDAWKPFYKLIDIVKIDFRDISEEDLSATLEQFKKYPQIKLLAEKVETNEEFTRAVRLGFDYFQGYFFSRPEVIRSVALTPGQTSIASLLNELSASEPNFNKISQLFELDVTLSFKLLRYTQTAMFKRQNPIKTIKQAVLVLGKNELERFVGLIFAAQFSDTKPQELIRLSIQRAKFCELLAPYCAHKNDASSAFLMGMMSLIDALLDADLKTVVSDLPLSSDIKDALLQDKGWLSHCLKLCKYFEVGDWEKMEKSCEILNIPYQEILDEYEKAGQWAEEKVGQLI